MGGSVASEEGRQGRMIQRREMHIHCTLQPAAQISPSSVGSQYYFRNTLYM